MLTDFRKKGNKNPYRQFLLVSGIIFIVAILTILLVANIRVYQKKRELNTQVENLKQKVQDLKSQNSNLKESTARSSDDAYIEKVAREELDLQLSGEKVFSFVVSEDQPKNNVAGQNIFPGWLGSVWDSFVGLLKR